MNAQDTRLAGRRAACTGLLLALAGCGRPAPGAHTDTSIDTGTGTHTEPAPPPIGYEVLRTTTLQDVRELSGRVVAVRTAEVRSQLSGIIAQRLFEPGAQVRAGQPLFRIDPATFATGVDSARAALDRAEAAAARSRTQAERLRPLADGEAVSRQAYEDALSQQVQATADVAQARAELARRRLDLQFTTITAPIAGRIDLTPTDAGALVGPGDTTPLARIQQIDTVHVDVRQPASGLERLQQAVAEARRRREPLQIHVLRDSGSALERRGQYLLSGLSVDAATGDALVRIRVDNTGHPLLPGMAVRARIVMAHALQALSVPQQAVSRDGARTRIWRVVGDKVQAVDVELGPRVGTRLIVRSGLRPGDRIVVEGLDRMSEGAPVQPREVPAGASDARQG